MASVRNQPPSAYWAVGWPTGFNRSGAKGLWRFLPPIYRRNTTLFSSIFSQSGLYWISLLSGFAFY